jgi:asparagine synthase (glutamine-hydrolysing)
VADLLRFDLEGYLPGDVLVKTDRASMAAGLELRSPFLDHRVAELCLRLPDEAKVDASGDKLVLREALGDRLAPGTTARPKRGFSGPMERWLQDPAVVERRRDLLVGPHSPLRDLLDPQGLAALADQDGQLGWNLLVLGLWAEANPAARR